VQEAADVVYHLTVALRALGVGLKEVEQLLQARAAAAHTRDRGRAERLEEGA
jgi:phosphoribosyl-ATP pyrophosphohydrolase